MAWNPFDRPDRVWRDLETSREVVAEDPVTGPVYGPPAAAVAFQKWTAGDRLAWLDTITTRTLTKNTDGDDTVRAGEVQLVHVMLTARAARGFPKVPVTRVGDDGIARDVVEEFNPRDEAHLRLLPHDVFQELYEHAADVQPPPTSRTKDKGGADTKAPADEAPVLLIGDENEDGGEAGDPTPAP